MTTSIAIRRENSSILDTFRRLVDMTPRDSYGFPEYLIDYQYIPDDIFERKGNFDAILKAAKIPLAIREGILTYAFGSEDGSPIWERMPNEPTEHFEVFKAYVNMPLRNVGILSKKLYGNYQDQTYLTEISTFYYWDDRARIYDILRPVAAARLRDHRVILTEDFHYQVTTSLLDQLTDEIAARSENNGRPFGELSAKHIIECLDTLVRIQRTSLNLPSTGRREATIPSDMTQKDAAEIFATSKTSAQTRVSRMEDKLSALAATDPAKFEKLQEIVISLHDE